MQPSETRKPGDYPRLLPFCHLTDYQPTPKLPASTRLHLSPLLGSTAPTPPASCVSSCCHPPQTHSPLAAWRAVDVHSSQRASQTPPGRSLSSLTRSTRLFTLSHFLLWLPVWPPRLVSLESSPETPRRCDSTHGLRSQAALVQVPALPLTSSMTLDIFVPQFPMSMEIKIPTS